MMILIMMKGLMMVIVRYMMMGIYIYIYNIIYDIIIIKYISGPRYMAFLTYSVAGVSVMNNQLILVLSQTMHYFQYPEYSSPLVKAHIPSAIPDLQITRGNSLLATYCVPRVGVDI